MDVLSKSLEAIRVAQTDSEAGRNSLETKSLDSGLLESFLLEGVVPEGADAESIISTINNMAIHARPSSSQHVDPLSSAVAAASAGRGGGRGARRQHTRVNLTDFVAWSCLRESVDLFDASVQRMVLFLDALARQPRAGLVAVASWGRDREP